MFREEDLLIETDFMHPPWEGVGCKNLIQIDLFENIQEFQSHLQFLVE
jgi:hypothetical protein